MNFLKSERDDVIRHVKGKKSPFHLLATRVLAPSEAWLTCAGQAGEKDSEPRQTPGGQREEMHRSWDRGAGLRPEKANLLLIERIKQFLSSWVLQ